MNIEPTNPPTDPPTDSMGRCEPQLEQRAKALFDGRVETLAPHIAQRLARARAGAVAEMSRSRATSWLSWRWLTLPRSAQWVAMVGGMTAALTAILVLLPVSPRLERMPATQGLGAEDVEFVASMNSDGDDIEMLQDLEFYSWLAAQPPAEDGASSDENIG